MELTPEEIKGGWTEEKLQKYLLEREVAQSALVLDRPPERPKWANSLYNPHKWW